MNRFIFIFSLLLLMISSSCITEDEPDTTSLKPGDQCPEFSVKMHDGSIVTTADLKGEKSIILFFNTSCADCRSELPQMQRVYEHIIAGRIPARLLCISRAEREESIERFWQENGLTLPYSAQEDRTVYNLFAQSVIPRIYILSPDLTIIRAWGDNPVPTAEEIIGCL